MTSVTIDPRYCGPPDIGQGGHVSGLLAEHLGGSDVLVSLRAPAPLGVPLDVSVEGDAARLCGDQTLLAEAVRSTLDLVVPLAPSMAEARGAAERFDRARHLYPGCFVCGPDRSAGDGWRIFPGPLDDGRVAAVWTPAEQPRPRDLWAALDCPGYFAVQREAGRALLARMQARIASSPPTGPLIVQGWALGSEGRKHRAATALHTPDGTLVAMASQLWVTVA